MIQSISAIRIVMGLASSVVVVGTGKAPFKGLEVGGGD